MDITNIKISGLMVSALNPRKTIDEQSIQELAENIKTIGVLQPITVRLAPKGSAAKYEIIFGERRFRASQIAGVKTIPAHVIDADDDMVRRLQLIENTHREDVNPMDEAIGISGYMEMNLTIGQIAAKINRSEKFIKYRLKLLNLIPKAQDLVRMNILPFGHAIRISALASNKQELALAYCVVYDGKSKPYTVQPVNMLEWHIKQNSMDLGNAPFDVNDDKLTSRGSCIDCKFRSSNNKGLFADDFSDDNCLDSNCFDEKKDEYIKKCAEIIKAKHSKENIQLISTLFHSASKNILTSQEYDIRTSSKKCKACLLAMIAESSNPEEIGKAVYICKRNSTCETRIKVNERVETRPSSSDNSEFVYRRLYSEQLGDNVIVEFNDKNVPKRSLLQRMAKELFMGEQRQSQRLIIEKFKWECSIENDQIFDIGIANEHEWFDQNGSKYDADQLIELIAFISLISLISDSSSDNDCLEALEMIARACDIDINESAKNAKRHQRILERPEKNYVELTDPDEAMNILSEESIRKTCKLIGISGSGKLSIADLSRLMFELAENSAN